MGRPLRIEYEMPDLEKIIKQAAKVVNEDAALLKRVQIYLCHKFSGQKLKEIGLHFGIGVSGVSQASLRVALQIKDDKKLKKRSIKLFQISTCQLCRPDTYAV